LLVANESIVSLKIGNSNAASRNRLGEPGTLSLVHYLHFNKFLELLDMRGMVLGDHLSKILAEAFTINTTVKHLNLQKNEIGFKGVEALGATLKVSGILVLNLSYNPLGDKGLKVFCESYLKERSCIVEELYFVDCKIKNAGSLFGMLARRSENPKYLDISHNKIN
jgi:Ran GTPase-activating protein (RanGAP) involved in mRNA processing and transport